MAKVFVAIVAILSAMKLQPLAWKNTTCYVTQHTNNQILLFCTTQQGGCKARENQRIYIRTRMKRYDFYIYLLPKQMVFLQRWQFTWRSMNGALYV
ncbi:MAG: hypothetical protein DCC43_04315 [Candidatus Brocadia sp.]|nr:hypothetical protein [Candidatus Brocadia sp. AMX3]RIK02097.1 MAG: hypothetical protein DCC43_04315 [Candidatus Brocadia sp.]